MDKFEFERLLEGLRNSPELKDEYSQALNTLRKGWNCFKPGEALDLLKNTLYVRMQGADTVQMAIMGILIINEILRVCPITEDEMMEVIRGFRNPEDVRK